MGTTGSSVARNAAAAAKEVERPLRTDITKRQLKTHVTSKLKEEGFRRAETYSTSIRGYREVRYSGYSWGEEYGGTFEPHIIYVGGLTSTRGDEFLDKVEKALSKDFKVERSYNSVAILGEYEKERK